MVTFRRFGVFVLPEGPLFDRASDWLGWNSAKRIECEHPGLTDFPVSVSEITQRPRKYGFHGTIKPPFVLADGANVEDLKAALENLTQKLSPVSIPHLKIRRLGRFFAIVSDKPSRDLIELAAATVENLDGFRAPLTEQELARRRKSRLSPRQDTLLKEWGYPYVMDEFKFHMTLTGPIAQAHLTAVESGLTTLFLPVLPQPFLIDKLALLGEAHDGRFHLIERYRLAQNSTSGHAAPHE